MINPFNLSLYGQLNAIAIGFGIAILTLIILVIVLFHKNSKRNKENRRANTAVLAKINSLQELVKGWRGDERRAEELYKGVSRRLKMIEDTYLASEYKPGNVVEFEEKGIKYSGIITNLVDNEGQVLPDYLVDIEGELIRVTHNSITAWYEQEE